MKQTINLHQFRNAFANMNCADNFSYEGLEILFNHFEMLEDETGEELELDVIAICCEYSEMTIEYVTQQYNLYELHEDEYSDVEKVREAIQYQTMLCGDYVNDNGETVFVFANW